MTAYRRFESAPHEKEGVTSFNNERRSLIIEAFNAVCFVAKPARQRRKMLFLIRTKACKRCGGDLSMESDQYGSYLECIQCGAVWNLQDLPSLQGKIKEYQPPQKLVNSGT